MKLLLFEIRRWVIPRVAGKEEDFVLGASLAKSHHMFMVIKHLGVVQQALIISYSIKGGINTRQ